MARQYIYFYAEFIYLSKYTSVNEKGANALNLSSSGWWWWWHMAGLAGSGTKNNHTGWSDHKFLTG